MAEPFIRPDVRVRLDLAKANPRPRATAEGLIAARANLAQVYATLDLPVGELAVTRDIVMRGPGGDIALRLFDTRTGRKPGPVVIHFHGGGFIVGNNDCSAFICAEITRRLDLPVITVDYRLAPEHPWPAAPDDAEAATRWIAENGAAFGLEITGLVLVGESAGANLVCVTTLALRDEPAAAPVLLHFPVVPVIEFTYDTESAKSFGEGFGLDSADRQLFDELYKPQLGHWRATPNVADLSGLPPLLMLTAGLDPIRDEGRAYAAKCVAAGVPTTFLEAAGTIHAFVGLRKLIPSGQADFVAALEAAKVIVAKSATVRS